MAALDVMTAKVKTKVENRLGTTLRCRHCLETVEVGDEVYIYHSKGKATYVHRECEWKRRF